MNTSIQPEPAAKSARWGGRRWSMLLLLGSLFGTLLFLFSRFLTLDILVAHETTVFQFYQNHPSLVIGICFLLYLTVTSLSLPGALAMSLSMAWLLGFWPAFLVISIASSCGATVAFLTARYLFRNGYQNRFATQLATFNDELDRNGPFYLFSLRLTPAVPFFMINVVMGITGIRTWTFFWVSMVGMAPWTAIFVNIGSRLPSLQSIRERGPASVLETENLLPITVGLILLGVFPLLIRWILARRAIN